jgi:hypothetical protein
MNLEIIVNDCIGMLLYNLILSSIGKVILMYFLQGGSLEKEKQTFQEKLKEKLDKQEK